MKLKAATDRIVIQEINPEEVRASGLVIAAETQKKGQVTIKAEVLDVGPGHKTEAGGQAETNVKKGDTIIVGKHQGNEVTIDGEKFIVIRFDLVDAIVEE